MNLISIGDNNVLINPEQIDYVEQRVVGVTRVTYVCVGGKDFILGIPLEQFFALLNMSDIKEFFAG